MVRADHVMSWSLQWRYPNVVSPSTRDQVPCPGGRRATATFQPRPFPAPAWPQYHSEKATRKESLLLIGRGRRFAAKKRAALVGASICVGTVCEARGARLFLFSGAGCERGGCERGFVRRDFLARLCPLCTSARGSERRMPRSWRDSTRERFAKRDGEAQTSRCGRLGAAGQIGGFEMGLRRRQRNEGGPRNRTGSAPVRSPRGGDQAGVCPSSKRLDVVGLVANLAVAVHGVGPEV